ncbi:hypothetical protein EBN03_14765 [Nocardia stercoris]|uniref:Uncharacterized protein n=2 Tax=Nocardia stercoris TaxID=2483361 RepID=A0A3M2L3F5_9NOCA|nr:hypothetical protein EBN03_14765 [Nocardia stercoris]
MPLFRETVHVREESPALQAEFTRLEEEHATSTLGALVTDSRIGIGQWDRMYSIASASDDILNSRLGTDLRWSGLPFDDADVQIFMNKGKVVYAYLDREPYHDVENLMFATPQSVVRTRQITPARQDSYQPPDYWRAEIESFAP